MYAFAIILGERQELKRTERTNLITFRWYLCEAGAKTDRQSTVSRPESDSGFVKLGSFFA